MAYTKKLTAGTYTWKQNFGFNKLGLYVLSTSTASATVLGNDACPFGENSAIDIEAGVPMTWLTDVDGYGDLTIVVPADCTLQIMAVKR